MAICERCRQRPGKEVYLVGHAPDWVECPHQWFSHSDDPGDTCRTCKDSDRPGLWAWNVAVLCEGCKWEGCDVFGLSIELSALCGGPRVPRNVETDTFEEWSRPHIEAYLAAQDRRCGTCETRGYRVASTFVGCPDCHGSGYRPLENP